MTCAWLEADELVPAESQPWLIVYGTGRFDKQSRPCRLSMLECLTFSRVQVKTIVTYW